MINNKEIANYLIQKLNLFDDFFNKTLLIVELMNDDYEKVLDILNKREEIINKINNIDICIDECFSHNVCENSYNIIYKNESDIQNYNEIEMDIYHIVNETKVKIESILALDRKIMHETDILKDSTLGYIKNLKNNRDTTKYLKVLGNNSSSNISIRYDKV